MTSRPPNIIEGYGAGGFRVSGVRYEGSLIILPEICLPWSAVKAADITLETLSPLWNQSEVPADLLLIGGGPTPWVLSSGLRSDLRSKGLAVEPMDSGAACRTYNVLLSEHRRVAAAILAVD